MSPQYRRDNYRDSRSICYTRSRSRSPDRHTNHTKSRHGHRSRSPQRTHRHRSHHHHHKHHRSSTATKPVILPCNAQPLSKHDFSAFYSLFALYLDIQKQLVIEELPKEEVRGRWKSFVGRWNRGELAEGWYDPDTKRKADESAHNRPDIPQQQQEDHASNYEEDTPEIDDDRKGKDEESEDDAVGPPLPGELDRRSRAAGPAIPSMQDLELRREIAAEDEMAAREDLRHARKLDRKEQKERLEELVPRPEAGTHERRMEKKREVNEKMRSFRDKSPGAGDEVGESDLMGGEDGISAYKAKKKEMERKKNERELRREEVLRARAAEREVRLRAHRAKEEKTVAMLKALAKQNFG